MTASACSTAPSAACSAAPRSREENALLRDARAVNDKVRLLAKLGAALIEAKDEQARPGRRGRDAVGWEKLAASVAEAERLARPDKADLPALAARAWPVLHRLGPLFLDAFQLRAVPGRALRRCARSSCCTTPIAAAAGPGRESLPTSFLRPAWRDAVLDAAARASPRTAASGRRPPCSRCATGCAPATSGSRAAGNGAPSRISSSRPRCSPPCARPGRCPSPCPRPRRNTWPERRALLDRRLAEVAAKAAADALEDVTDQGRRAEDHAAQGDHARRRPRSLAERLYGMMPNVRITSLLAEVHRWTGFADGLHPPAHRPAGR